MEALAILSLVGNVVQFVEFSSKLIAKSTELYRSSEGALGENIEVEAATNHLVLLNSKIKDSATTTSDDALDKLCESCKSTADELLAALDKVKVKGKQNRWKSIRKALRSVWSKEQIRELEGRLARLREELNLHVLVDLRCVSVFSCNNYTNYNMGYRQQVLRIEQEKSSYLKDFDLVTQSLVNAILKQQDVFEAVHDAQVAEMKKLHGEMVLRVKNEHATTRNEIIEATALNNQAEHEITRQIIQEVWVSVPLTRLRLRLTFLATRTGATSNRPT